MEKTIVLTVDYKLNRYSWNDQIGFSGGQPFGTNPSTSFDYVYDLLKEHGYGDIIFDIERGEIKEDLKLIDIVSHEEIQGFLKEELINKVKKVQKQLILKVKKVPDLKEGEEVVFKKASQNFNGYTVDASSAIGKIIGSIGNNYLIIFDDETFFPVKLRGSKEWNINKYLVTKRQ